MNFQSKWFKHTQTHTHTHTSYNKHHIIFHKIQQLANINQMFQHIISFDWKQSVKSFRKTKHLHIAYQNAGNWVVDLMRIAWWLSCALHWRNENEKKKYKTQNTKLCEAFDCVLCSLFVGRAFGRCLCLYVAVGFSPCTSFLCFCSLSQKRKRDNNDARRIIFCVERRLLVFFVAVQRNVLV